MKRLNLFQPVVLPLCGLLFALVLPVSYAAPLHVIDVSRLYPQPAMHARKLVAKKKAPPVIVASPTPVLPVLSASSFSSPVFANVMMTPAKKVRPPRVASLRKVESAKTVSQTFKSMNLPACMDGKDNDGDRLIDYPEDPKCFAEFDSEE